MALRPTPVQEAAPAVPARRTLRALWAADTHSLPAKAALPAVAVHSSPAPAAGSPPAYRQNRIRSASH